MGVAQALLASFGGAAAGGIALVQQSVGSSTDGSVPLIIPFGSAVVAGVGGGSDGEYTYTGQYKGHPYFNLSGTDPTTSAVSWDGGGDGYDGYGVWDAGAGEISGSNDVVALPWQGVLVAGTVTCSSPVTAGNSVLVQIALIGTEGPTFSPALIGGAAGTLTQGVANEAGNNIWVYNYYRGGTGIAGGESGVTLTLSKPAPVAVNISEWSGLADAGPSQTDTNSGTSTTPGFSSTNPLADTLTLVSYATVGDNYQSGPTNSFTRLTPANVTGIFLESAYLVGAGSAPTWMLDSSVDWSSIATRFDAA